MGVHEQEKPRPAPAEVAPRDDVRVLANRCPYCHEAVRVDADRWVSCRDCQGRHHEDCWDEAAACSACGGAVRLIADVPAPPPELRTAVTYAWQVGPHEVCCQLGMVGGQEVVTVNGRTVVDLVSYRLSNDHPLKVGGRAGRIEVRVGWNLVARARLVLDGVEVPPVRTPPRWVGIASMLSIPLLVGLLALLVMIVARNG